MKKIEENIFYRIYVIYLARDYPAKFVSSLYIAFIYIFLFAPVYGLCVDLIHGVDKLIIKFLYAFYFLLILIRIFIKYYNKVILTNVFKENKNKKIIFPNWCYFLILPLSMIFGIGLYILLSQSIMQKFNLEGYLYNL